MLILAGITISLTIGQRGVLNRAQEAGRNYREVAKGEENELSKFTQEVDNIILEIDTPNLPSEPKYTEVEGVPVPKGFTHIEGTKDTGFVIKDISVDKEGNPTQTNGNEFVWVPCTENGENGSIQYERYAFSTEGWIYSQIKDDETKEIKMNSDLQYSFTEAMKEEEINSIKQYGGFYIGRYEVGIEDYKGNVITSNSSGLTNWTGYSEGKAVIQENKQVWNYITKDKAKDIAEGMYQNSTIVTSRLCSSYAWDTTLQFIGEEYATNSTNENYSRELKRTGRGSIAVKNVYDMGGNVAEWTTEIGNRPDRYCCTQRGGNYITDENGTKAAIRFYMREIDSESFIGFRVSLYIEV